MDSQSQTLYRKWRSQTFRDLIGQDAIVQTLRQAVATQRLTHAYLFSGPRGTGKTSMARLLAKMVNCENPVEGEPCNTCLSCREITEGRSTDVYEIDAASNRGIDEIRDLRERVRVSSAVGRTRFYTIDEVHMLTTEAFNALLKTLEEPPPRVIFVLATTESHKVPATVISRCQRFDFHRITIRDIVGRLKYVADQETFQYEPESLEIIARAAQGGMRDAMSLLDQAHAFSGDSIGAVDVRNMLGMADPSLIQDLVRFVAVNDSAAGLQRIYDLVQSGSDVRQVMTQVTELWRQLLLARAGANIVHILDISDEEAAILRSMAEQFTVSQLADCARIFSHTDGAARVQVIPQLQLELAFLDCIATVHTVAQQVVHAAPLTATKLPTPSPMAAKEAHNSIHSPPSQLYSASPDQVKTTANIAETPTIERTFSAQSPMNAKPNMPEYATDQATASPAAAKLLEQLQQDWDTVVKIARQRKDNTYALMVHARPHNVVISDKTTVVLAMENDLLHKKLSQRERVQTLTWSIEQVLNTPCEVQIILIEKQEKTTQQPRLAAVADAQNSPRQSPRNSQQTVPASAADIAPASFYANAAPPSYESAAMQTSPAREIAQSQPEQDPILLARQDPVIRQVLQNYQADLIEIIEESEI